MDNMKEYAPIVIFAYKRKSHLIQVVNSLKKNLYADRSTVIVYSDGFRGEDDRKEVLDVREYLGTLSGFEHVEVIERDRNYGLASNIIQGVTDIVNKYGKVIVLEDDIVPCKYFLKYMNEALNLYENEESVMEISGYAYPHGDDGLPETAFLHFADCWGWGTWKRAWSCFEKNPQKLVDSFSESDIYRFNLDGSYPFWSQVRANLTNKINTWAIFWQASIFIKNGLMLYPTRSLVINIGFDGSGENCGNIPQNEGYLIEKPIMEYPLVIEENSEVRSTLAGYLKKH